MLTEQCGHFSTSPQSGHSKIFEYPRLFKNKIACSPSSSLLASFSFKILEMPAPGFSRFMSTMNTDGILLPSIRCAIFESAYLPVFTLCSVSRAGVAEPKMQAQPASFARITATSLPLYRGDLSCL